MNAKYLGRKVIRNEFGDIVSRYDPCVQISMKGREVNKFRKMMDYISENYFKYNYDLFGEVDDETTAYVYVDDGADAADFMECYKEAKKATK